MIAAAPPFQSPVIEWFEASFDAATPVQLAAWPAIARGESALLLAPTGSGKTLAAFLSAIDRLMVAPEPGGRLRVLYVSPLKALGADVEKNLARPLAGIAEVCRRRSLAYHAPEIAVRSGDTPARERARFGRHPPDILITTPESLYLLLTSRAREQLRSIDTVIVDEIHAVAGAKRGAHLAVSLERLEALRGAGPPLQRIGLSATQRPLGEVASLLGGFAGGAARPVTVIDAAAPKELVLRVELPEAPAPVPAARTRPAPSAWDGIHARLVELIRAHHTTMVFVNNRRLAERLAAAVNELAGEELALAHHGSVAAARRVEIEDRLKRGSLSAIVATSSLELGIDMGAVDLVVQVESPPSVASGLQRIGRSGHSVGAASKGVLLPKFRGDLLSSAAATAAMAERAVEATAYPRNPLDVLAQQIVATVAMDAIHVDALFELMCRAAPFAELSRPTFDGVLDMLSGRYPGGDLAGLRPRIVWNRVSGMLRAHEGARRLAVVNGGTIPDRGLYGVFLAGGDQPVRVGELDEEMVFESQPGDVFLLGASSWRIEDITHDRVLVVPAHGEPGKMPFWHGDRAGRPYEFGEKIGRLARELTDLGRDAALAKLVGEHGFDRAAAVGLVDYLRDQRAHTGELPTDRTLIVERFTDEQGEQRICLLSPFGARVHAAWGMALTAQARRRGLPDPELVWSDDGMVLRFPETDRLPGAELFALPADEVGRAISEVLPESSLFAARFRENAARALLLPRRLPGRRSPLWIQRKRAADLLAVASRYPSFPIVLETFRDCLRDVFDVPALTRLLASIAAGDVRIVSVDSATPSPFAASLLFSYVANFIYDADAPLAERRAQALTLDQTRLRELLGEAELRELLDPEQVTLVARRVGRLDPGSVRSADSLHDVLRELGPLTEAELARRAAPAAPLAAWLEELRGERRIFVATIGGARSIVAVEDAGRLQSALGVELPPDLPDAFTEPVPDALDGLIARYARGHGPFTADAVAAAFGLAPETVLAALVRSAAGGRLIEGEFLRGERGREWCDSDVLRSIKQRSLAKLRRQVEPVEQALLARFAGDWQGLARPRRGADALAGALEQLQGAPLVVSALEQDVLPLRVAGYSPALLDALAASGGLIWRGVEALGASDARIAFYLPEQYALLAPATVRAEGKLAGEVRRVLEARGASFFWEISAQLGGFGGELLQALWELVFAGEVTNDTLAPLRSLLRSTGRAASGGRGGRLRRPAPPGSEGRWSLLPVVTEGGRESTARAAALATSLLERHGVLTREAAQAEGLAGGFSSVYGVLKAMEQAGRVRRGYFVEGLGAAQFAAAGADERLRLLRDPPPLGEPRTFVLAATDPAQPYGATLPWPEAEPRPMRAAGALVVLDVGRLIGYVARGSSGNLQTFLPKAGAERLELAARLAGALAELVGRGRRRALLVNGIDNHPAARSDLVEVFRQAGFVSTSRGLFLRPSRSGGETHAAGVT